jgi:phospholipid/cholesterol/gamma-HCH transport system substrate-binding protein
VRRVLTGRVIGLIVAVAVIVAGVLIGLSLAGGSSTMQLTADFPQTIGLYEGNAVDVMGVKIGTVDKLVTEGSYVRATITYDSKYKLPADVKAALITPSVVSDRYVQLTPAYTGGPVLPNNAHLGLSRTAIPLEYDDIFRNLDQLNQALGPKGANKHGALSQLIKISDRNLRGNGSRLNSALKNFTEAISTLSGNRGNLFSMVRHLQQFTTTVANDDGGVRALNRNLQLVGNQLNNERHDLSAALANLSGALKLVDHFVATNRKGITTDLHGATRVARALLSEKTALTQIVDMAPTAVANLALAGDPRAKTLDTVTNLTYEVTPEQVCKALTGVLSGIPDLGGLLGGGAGDKLCANLPKSSSRIGTAKALQPNQNGLSELLGGVGSKR